MGKPSRTIDDAAEGTPLTLEAIMAEHQEAVRRYVERQGFHGADRDDLVQEIFHGAARSLPRFDPRRATVRTWLLRIAFNLISHERKRAHRRHEALWPEEALDELSSDAPDSETRLIEAQRGEILAELLLSVPPARREILVAHDLEESAVQDIAEERALPRNTVWNHLRLARLSLGAAARRW
ncbi:RNA polymerase sigma factor, partial [Sorangium cellulosum]|uniref:RNA polymerase sigma factor n=1 Tax=Sorangium cellulosum TaxID=56 RepID=UPI000B1FE494